MLHGSLDMSGAVLEFIDKQDRPGMKWIIKITPATGYTSVECGLQLQEVVRQCSLN